MRMGISVVVIAVFGILGQILVSTSGAQETKRSKNLNFEDELVEGINRRPLDSFQQISEIDRDADRHLYKKRSGFADRDEVLLSEMGVIR